ncbi:MAG: hypothetical protein JW893_04245 [Candidatus Omnitrophica bacterium]|nr:hypothetical protein [Candidatus Omnitrophota bacterium]
MIFHLGYELPKPVSTKLDHESPDLTDEEVTILKRQITQNARVISQYVERLDLFLNKEKVPSEEKFVRRLRRRLEVLMEENDTFREVLWKHFQKIDFLKSRSDEL